MFALFFKYLPVCLFCELSRLVSINFFSHPKRHVNRNYSIHELYDIRRHQIRSNQLESSQPAGTQIASFTSDDIDSVYMPWMIENYGRKLAIEALKRRGNMCGESTSQTTLLAPRKPMINQQQQRTKSPYVSQYYAQINDRPNSSLRPNDLWLIDRGIRRRLKRSARKSAQPMDADQSDEVGDFRVGLV